MIKRQLDVVVISDVHLGTYGSHAKELNQYLKSIDPKKIILNGDIIDIWSYNKNYFPKSHLNVIKQIVKMASNGVEVYYITGNHDDLLRKFSDFNLANLYLVDKLVLKIKDKRAWIFHGDVFDISMKHTTKLAKLGGKAYDYLILLNRYVNALLKRFGRQPYSFSKKIKDSVKRAVKYVSDFELTAAELAIDKNYDYVICGHIHQPQKRIIRTDKGNVMYMNSGDWVENLTALEFYNEEWHVFHYTEHEALITEFTDIDLEESSEIRLRMELEILEIQTH
jgi:UDP-2,3-diacylglucosamine pyrophosphatase LpxH